MFFTPSFIAYRLRLHGCSWYSLIVTLLVKSCTINVSMFLRNVFVFFDLGDFDSVIYFHVSGEQRKAIVTCTCTLT